MRIWNGTDGEMQGLLRVCTAFVPIVSRHSAEAMWLDLLVARARTFHKLIYPLNRGSRKFSSSLEVVAYEWFNEQPSARWFQRLHAICDPAATLPSKIFRWHRDGIWALAYEARTTYFASGGWDKFVRVWTNVQNQDAQNDERFILPQGERVLALAYAPDGRELAIGLEDGTIRIWDPRTREYIAELTDHIGAVRCLAYSANGRTLFSASVDKTARVWQRQPEEPHAVDTVTHDINVLGVAIAPEGTTFATASEDKTVRLWNYPSLGDPMRRLEGHTETAWGVAYSPKGHRIASVSRDKTVRIWDRHSGKELRRFDGHQSSVICVAYSSDGRYLATGGADETARIWEVETGRLVATFVGHSDAVRVIAFAPDLIHLTTGSADGTLMHWPLPLEAQPVGQ
jgi:WD40 repeat protein